VTGWDVFPLLVTGLALANRSDNILLIAMTGICVAQVKHYAIYGGVRARGPVACA